MEETNKTKLIITQSIFLGLSYLLVVLSMVLANTFVSWIVFVGLGFGIYVFMSNVVPAIKNRDLFSIICAVGSLICILTSVAAILLYVDTVETFIGSMI